MAELNKPLNMQTRYMAIRLILDSGQFPSSPQGTGNPQNVKTIFANSDTNSLTVEATITKASGLQANSAYVTIYGMTIEDCNAFTRFNKPGGIFIYQNRIEIYAGYSIDKETKLPPLAYKGDVYLAGANFNDPSRPFNIISMSGLGDQNILIESTNPPGVIPLETLFSSIVAKSSKQLNYVGRGVVGTTNNANFQGSWIEQLQQACAANGYQMKLDDDTVVVTHVGDSYRPNTFLLNKDTGMLGYPNIVEWGVDVRCRYNPEIYFGQQIEVKSDFQSQANKVWFINGLSHILQNRGEKWESILKLNEIFFNLPLA